MEKIFYTQRIQGVSSESVVKRLLKEYFRLENPKIMRTENGKPYLADNLGVYFSISHTNDALFIAVSKQNVGLDVEREDRRVNYLPVLNKFSKAERESVQTQLQFLKVYTAKESAVKWLGAKLATHLKRIEMREKNIYLDGERLDALLSYPTLNGYVVAVTGADFTNAPFIRF